VAVRSFAATNHTWKQRMPMVILLGRLNLSVTGGVSAYYIYIIILSLSFDFDCRVYLTSSILFSLLVFVPKFDVFDGNGTKKYRLRPDTCIGGCCVMCRCGGKGSGGKCCRIPYIVRDPNTVSINLAVSSILFLHLHLLTSYSFHLSF
jgi:hypothetical protein